MVKIFVYGTLKKGFPLYTSLESEVQEDSITGTMYSMRAYPAIKLEGDGKIHGEVHTVPKESLTLFDQIESEGFLYKRKDVVTDGGIECQVYEFMRGTEGLEKVDNGAWENR